MSKTVTMNEMFEQMAANWRKLVVSAWQETIQADRWSIFLQQWLNYSQYARAALIDPVVSDSREWVRAWEFFNPGWTYEEFGHWNVNMWRKLAMRGPACAYDVDGRSHFDLYPWPVGWWSQVMDGRMTEMECAALSIGSWYGNVPWKDMRLSRSA